MTSKQEEIREGIGAIRWSVDLILEEALEGTYRAGKWGADPIITIDKTKAHIKESLHSQGVVIKVERELPVNIYKKGSIPNKILNIGYERMLNYGYAAVEPLIEEAQDVET